MENCTNTDRIDAPSGKGRTQTVVPSQQGLYLKISARTADRTSMPKEIPKTKECIVVEVNRDGHLKLGAQIVERLFAAAGAETAVKRRGLESEEGMSHKA